MQHMLELVYIGEVGREGIWSFIKGQRHPALAISE